MNKFIQIVMGRIAVLVNNPKFKEAIGSKLGFGTSVPNPKFVQQVTTWVNNNPLKSQAILASSLSVIPSALPTIFGSDELPLVAQELQNVDFGTGNYTESQTAALESISGDRKSGYYGSSNEEVVKSADLVAASLKKTERLARLFGLRESDVEEAVMLIQSYELSDGAIYRKMSGN